MIRSMTGFGSGEAARDGYKAVFEVSSVNSRFLEVSLRLPRGLLALEPSLRALVDGRLSRGKIFCQLSWERTSWNDTQLVNEPLADWYIGALRRLAAKHNLAGDLTVSDLTRIPDLWTTPSETADETAQEVLSTALTAAIEGLQKARVREGAALAEDLRKRLAHVDALVQRIDSLAATVPAAIRDKLSTRIRELFGEGQHDPQRLAQEIAYIAERADITEECVRLQVHRQSFVAALDEAESVGRRLNFLMQEMNREANTIGSKSLTAEISSAAVQLKEELERIREQVQNIE